MLTADTPQVLADSDLATALRYAEGALTVFGDQAAREARWLLTQCLGISVSRTHIEPNLTVSAAQMQRLANWCQRRAAGEPLAYLVGQREFWSLDFVVTPAVLVPRPETELLVELVLHRGDQLARELERVPRIVDLGTGSGAIAIALAHERPSWNITAVDLSPAALQLAAANATRLGVKLELLLGSWFEPLGEARYDIVVSNPPYVAGDDPVLQNDSLRFEPRMALTPGYDAYADLQHLQNMAPHHLNEGGWLLLEHGASQGAEMQRRLVARGYAHVVSVPDLAGLERVTLGRWMHPTNSTQQRTT